VPCQTITYMYYLSFKNNVAILSFTTESTRFTKTVANRTTGTTCVKTIIAQNSSNLYTKITLTLSPKTGSAIGKKFMKV
jgi:hypothetical protein